MGAFEQKNKIKESYPSVSWDLEKCYSMIEKYDQENSTVLKIGGHFLRTDIEDMDTVWVKELTSKEIQWSKENTEKYLALLNLPIATSDLEFTSGYSCVYSLTASEVPYVTHAINNGYEVDFSFVIVGGMSGIGAKGSLTYGLIASNLLLNRDDPTAIYQKTNAALRTERLAKDLQNLIN